MNYAVGKNIKRLDAFDKVQGKSKYPDDIEFDGMVYAGVLRSTIPYGKIISVDYDAAYNMPGVLKIIDRSMIPGEATYGVVLKDQPTLAGEMVRRVGDPILIVVAETKSILKRALNSIKVNYEEFKGIFSIEDALNPEAPVLGEKDNILYKINVIKGDSEKGFNESDYIVENNYTTPAVDHAFLQTEAAVSKYDGDMLEIYVATQYAHYDREEVARALKIPENKINIKNTSIGGAFGAREDISVQIHAALAAFYLKRPVKIVLDREESTLVRCKRHAFKMYYKTGVKKDGRLCAMEAKIVGDTGAYCSWGMNILRKAAVHATGPYVIPNVKVESMAVYTNNSFAGAMRGFGAAQVAFAYESQMDMLAERLHMNPLKFRYMNCFEQGSKTATGQTLTDSVGIKKCIEEIAKLDGIEL